MAWKKVFPYSFYFTGIFYRGLTSASWPSVDGVVVETGVTRASYMRGGVCFFGVVVYRYIVDGRVYEASFYDSRLRGRCFSGRSEAVRYVSDFEDGDNVTVYYLPEKPSVALLKPGFQPATLILFAAGSLLFISLSIFFIHGTLIVYKKWRIASRK
jgi:hypothetical protein